MRSPAPTPDETERLAALEALHIVYSPAEERFDRITMLARKIFDVPIALVSLVSGQCQWFKSAQGLSADQTPREISFCGHAIHTSATFLVEDTLLAPDFADNPLVTGAPHIRFYAGQPLSYAGRRVGTLCVIDTQPRQMSPSDLETLRNLAEWVENELVASALSAPQLQVLAERDEAARAELIDPLTKTWNRSGAQVLITRELAALGGEAEWACLAVRLVAGEPIRDRNDLLDECMLELARRSRTLVRPQDLIARNAPDSLLIWAADCTAEMAESMAEQILRRLLGEAISSSAGALQVRIDLGVVQGKKAAATDFATLERRCRGALDAAAEDGGNTYRLSLG